jgi:flagellin-like protein
MKRIWTIRKDEEAVSPVIATILMVAITVVLAAVLYVMVLGINAGGGNTVIVSFSKDSTTTNWTLTVTGIGGTSQLAQADVYVTAKNAAGVTILAPTALTVLADEAEHNSVWYDDTAGDAYLNSGDTFFLERATFAPGSSVILTDQAGTATYANQPI